MNSPTDTQPAPIRLPAWLLRFVLINFLLMDGVMMWRAFAVHYDGLDVALIYLCFGFVLPMLTLACLPCFVLAPQLRSQDLSTRRRALLHSAWPMALALLTGTAICFGNWENLWFVVTPLVPPLAILAAVASKSRAIATNGVTG
jgi:hypothetical protein